jgi:hypothetical protein
VWGRPCWRHRLLALTTSIIGATAGQGVGTSGSGVVIGAHGMELGKRRVELAARTERLCSDQLPDLVRCFRAQRSS